MSGSCLPAISRCSRLWDTARPRGWRIRAGPSRPIWSWKKAWNDGGLRRTVLPGLTLLHCGALVIVRPLSGHIRIPMSFGTWLFTRLHGELVGTDSSGNRYYLDRRTKGQKRERRWVMYKGEVEASKVTPEWHTWLHGVGAPPTGEKPRAWQKPY